jgi:hypothetical protein
MTSRFLIAAAFGAAALLVAPIAAGAQDREPRQHDRAAADDCKPFNGPNGYHGNPWCDNGWKYAEDYPPGTGPDFDILDLPQVRRLTRRWE